MGMLFSPCGENNGPDCPDASIQMLRQVFGKVIDNLLSDGGNSAADKNHVLANMFGVFNNGVLTVAILIAAYVGIVGTLNTANDGEALGRGWSSL